MLKSGNSLRRNMPISGRCSRCSHSKIATSTPLSMGPPPDLRGGSEFQSLFEPTGGSMHSPAANHAYGPAPSLLCKPAQPLSAYQAFSQDQLQLLPGPFAQGEKERHLRERWKALSKPEKAHYKVKGIERRNRSRSPYKAFCQAHRPLLPPDLRNSKREAALGQMWGVLSETERAKFAPISAAPAFPPPVPCAPVRAHPLPAASVRRSAPPLEKDYSRGKRAKTAARNSPSAALTVTLPAPLAPLAPPAPLARWQPPRWSAGRLAPCRPSGPSRRWSESVGRDALRRPPPPVPAPPFPVAVAVAVPMLYYPIAVEGWEAAAATAAAAAGWAHAWLGTTASRSPRPDRPPPAPAHQVH